MSRAVVLSAVRTPVGRYGGGLAAVRPDDLAALAVAAAVERAGVPAEEIEDLWLGCANQAGEDNRNVARFAALLDARRRLADLAETELAVQLGGAAGTLSALGDEGMRTVEALAGELGLAVPTLPWHTNRVRVAGLGAALATLAGVCGKIGLDVVQLSQTEVAEVREAAGGGSSAMPQKRNPVQATLTRSCAALAAAAGAQSFRDALLADPRAGLEADEVDALLDPTTYLGSAGALVDRALARYDTETQARKGGS